jgi:hypothetical protein
MVDDTNMIHIATVHWNTAEWIAPQLKFLGQHLQSEFRVYAWLNNIPDAPRDLFHFSCVEPVRSHAMKLNILADVIQSSAASPDDILIFLDGDAFPIADLEAMVREKVAAHKLVAVQRLENNGDSQPHPCFCATTVGFWNSIQGDWNDGYEWKNSDGETVTDVGGNMLKKLLDRGIDWAPLLRSNKVNLHPLYFGIYGGVIYHHGAGFRKSMCRLDRTQIVLSSRDKILSKIVPFYRKMARMRATRKIVAKNHAISEEVIARILKDPQFYRQFM